MPNTETADARHPAMCRWCVAENKPAWHDPNESGEWIACSDHLLQILRTIE